MHTTGGYRRCAVERKTQLEIDDQNNSDLRTLDMDERRIVHPCTSTSRRWPLMNRAPRRHRAMVARQPEETVRRRCEPPVRSGFSPPVGRNDARRSSAMSEFYVMAPATDEADIMFPPVGDQVLNRHSIEADAPPSRICNTTELE